MRLEVQERRDLLRASVPDLGRGPAARLAVGGLRLTVFAFIPEPIILASRACPAGPHPL